MKLLQKFISILKNRAQKFQKDSLEFLRLQYIRIARRFKVFTFSKPCFIVLENHKNNSKFNFISGANDCNTMEMNFIQSIKRKFKAINCVINTHCCFLGFDSLETIIPNQYWKRLTKLLNQTKLSRNFAGILMLIPYNDLHLGMKEESLSKYMQFIDKFYAYYRKNIPLYFIISDMQDLPGFESFSNYFSKEHLQQVFGISLFLKEKDQDFYPSFEYQYNHLIQSLYKQMPWALEVEKSQTERDLIFYFPKQFQKLKSSILKLFKEIVFIGKYSEKIIYLGVYFFGNDKCMHSSSNDCANKKNHKVIFLEELVTKQIQEDMRKISISQYKNEPRHIVRLGLKFALPLIIILMLIHLHNDLKFTEKWLKNNSSYLKLQKLSRTDKQSLPNAILMLNQIHVMRKNYNKNLSFFSLLMITRYQLNTALNALQSRILHSILLPLLASNYQRQLLIGGKNLKRNYIYFKAYYAFHYGNPTAENNITLPLLFDFRNKKLLIYTKLASLTPAPKLPLDNEIITSYQTKLRNSNLSERVLINLEVESNQHNKPTKIKRLFENLQNDFIIKAKDFFVPYLLTKQGINDFFRSNYTRILKETIHDDQRMNLISNPFSNFKRAKKHLLKNFQIQYINYWKDFLNSMNIKPVNTYTQLQKRLTQLINNDSNFQEFIRFATKNTTINNPKFNTIDYQFSGVRRFANNESNYNWKTFRVLLTHLKKYLLINDIGNIQGKKATLILNTTINNQHAFLNQFIEKAKAYPKPISKLLLEVAKNTWYILCLQSMSYIKQIWHDTIYLPFHSDYVNLYPFNEQSQQSIAMSDFNDYFSKNGKINQFYRRFIRDLTVINHGELHIKRHDLFFVPFSQQGLHFFSYSLWLTKQLYIKHKHTPLITLKIQTVNLTPKAEMANLQINHQIIIYRHGPKERYILQWPNTRFDNATILKIKTFSGKWYTRNFTGTWSLFRFLQAGNLQKANYNQFFLTFDLNGNIVEYKISPENSFDLKKFLLLSKLNIPSKLFKES